MVLKRLFLALCCTLPLIAPGAALRADDGPLPGEVVLPLKDYLTLVESAEAADRAREQRAAQQAAPVAEVVSQRTSVRVEDGEARVISGFEVLIQGHPRQPVTLPLAGFPASAEVRREGRPAPDAAVSAVPGGRGGVLLVAPAAGRYEVEVRGQAPLESLGGINRLAFPPAAAPVAVLELDLPADAGWSVPGGVVVEESERDGRRRIVLAAQRGEAQALELRRRFDSSEAGKLLAQSVVLTLFQLRPEGPRRHDVVLYEVSRGALGSFDVALPPGVEVELAATDEGPAVPVAGSGRLTVHRHRQLQGTGYLVLTSTPPAGIVTDGTALGFIDPGLDVRARYLAVASSIAADVRPQPEASWARVDLEDLPPSLREALQVVDLAAAWRLANESPGIRLAVSALPPAPSLDLVVRRRETTTLLTVDGTLLHRDRFTLGPVSGMGAALDLVLPAGATLWSASVGDQPVRPLERGGTVSVPLGFETGREAVVEVVAVLDRAIPPGRSALAMDLPQVTAPVLDHRWRLLLPEGPRYRFKDGDLRPTAEGDAVRMTVDSRMITDRMNVGGHESGPSAVAHGPGGNSAVTGRVVDERGYPLPGATLTLTSPAMSSRIVQVSDIQGRFRFIALPSGNYSIQAELEGFSSAGSPDIGLPSGRTADLEITLSAAVEDVITVTSTSEERPRSYDFGRKRKEKQEEKREPSWRGSALYAQEVQALQQGLVGGVKPLSITIPEAGKALLLTGILPPGKVSVELEVRAKR